MLGRSNITIYRDELERLSGELRIQYLTETELGSAEGVYLMGAKAMCDLLLSNDLPADFRSAVTALRRRWADVDSMSE